MGQQRPQLHIALGRFGRLPPLDRERTAEFPPRPVDRQAPASAVVEAPGQVPPGLPARVLYDVGESTGDAFRAIIVNGTPIREDRIDTVDPEGPLPGAVLRASRG